MKIGYASINIWPFVFKGHSSAMRMLSFPDEHIYFNIDIETDAPNIINVTDLRNRAVAAAIQCECDALLLVDGEVQIPQDTLIKLLNIDADIVSGTVFRITPPFEPLIYVEEGLNINTEPELARTGSLINVTKIPSGCYLIHRRVWDNLPLPLFFEESFPGTEQRLEATLSFSKKAYEHECSLVIDPTIHVERQAIWTANWRTWELWRALMRDGILDQIQTLKPQFANLMDEMQNNN